MHDLTVQIDSFDFDASVFTPLRSSSETLDNFISNEGGTFPATSTMVTGSPGAGKTTLMFEMLSDYQKRGNRVAAISAEMSKIDVASYTQRFPHWAQLPIFFPDFDRDILDDIQTLFDYGYDVVVIDSFKEVKDMIADQRGWTKTKTEIKLINMMKDAMMGDNENGSHTAFYVIQQVLKSGDFAGSKRLEHIMTANLKMVVDGNERYLMYEKNRRGQAHRKLYYKIHEDSITYNQKRRELEEDSIDFVEKESERQQQSQQDFDSLDDLLSQGAMNGNISTEDEVEMPPEPDAPVESEDDIDLEIVAETLRAMDGNVSATLRTLKSNQAVPEDYTRYYLQKLIDNNGLERKRYN
jgi:predicted ATP-dependent serine protease